MYQNYITKGKLNAYQVFTYRTKDGEAYYKFSYHQTDNGYEIDIHEQPSYGKRSSNLVTSHRLTSKRDTEYQICVSLEYYPQNLEDAQKLSMEWAELTHAYIKTGITIDRQIEMRN